MKLRTVLEQKIKEAEQGMNIGLPMGFSVTKFNDKHRPELWENTKLSRFICGIQKARYDLWGGLPGTGKTALVDDLYIHNPLKFLHLFPEFPIKYKVEYFNLELPLPDKMMKFAARQIFETTGQLYSATVLGGKRSALPSHIADMIRSTYEYFDKLEEYVRIDCTGLNPKFFYKRIMRIAEENGKLFYLNTKTLEIRQYTHEALVKERGLLKQQGTDDPWIFNNYIKNDPYTIFMFLIDHIGLTKYSSYRNKKEALDALSGYAVDGRNNFGFAFCFVSQFNRGNEDVSRIKNSPDPMLADFKETGTTQEDANFVGATYNPFRHKQEVHNGYERAIFGTFYRSVSILKNRDGADNIDVPFGFRGDIGEMKELPLIQEMTGSAIQNKELLDKIVKYYTRKEDDVFLKNR